MFCPKCGAQVPDGSPFCSSCGAQMGQQQAPTNQGFSNPGNAFNNAFKSADLNPKSMIDDFVAFFKKPSFTIQQIIAWAGALLLFISTFLPHHKSSFIYISESYNLWSGRGAFYWLFFLIFVLATFFFATIKRHICVLAVGAACVFWSFLDIVTTSGITISKSIGVWFIFISSVAILVAGIWGFIESKKK